MQTLRLLAENVRRRAPAGIRQQPGLVLLVVLAMALALTGCGDGIREFINPPGASVQRLEVATDGGWKVTLRVQNFSNVLTEFEQIELALYVDGRRAGMLSRGADLIVESDSVELLVLDLDAAAAAQTTLASESALRNGFAYRLEGSIETRKPRGRYPIAFDSRLAPVPGRAGEFR